MKRTVLALAMFAVALVAFVQAGAADVFAPACFGCLGPGIPGL